MKQLSRRIIWRQLIQISSLDSTSNKYPTKFKRYPILPNNRYFIKTRRCFHSKDQRKPSNYMDSRRIERSVQAPGSLPKDRREGREKKGKSFPRDGRVHFNFPVEREERRRAGWRMCTRPRGNSKSHGTTVAARRGSEPSSLMSFCVAVTRSTSVYDSSATFFECRQRYNRSERRAARQPAHKFKPSASFPRVGQRRPEAACAPLGLQYFFVRSPSSPHLLFLPVVFPLFPVCIVLWFHQAELPVYQVKPTFSYIQRGHDDAPTALPGHRELFRLSITRFGSAETDRDVDTLTCFLISPCQTVAKGLNIVRRM